MWSKENNKWNELGFCDFSCGDTAGTDLDPFGGSINFDLDFLKVREESTQSLSNDL